MTFLELIDAYVQHLRTLNASPRSIKVQRSRLIRFMEHMEGKGLYHPSEATSSFLREYQGLLASGTNARGNVNGPDLCNNHVSVIKCFFRYLKREDCLAYNPADELEYARTPKRLPKAILTTQEVKRLLGKPDVNTPLGFRDRTIIEVLYSTGIRSQELRNLTIEDVNLESGLLMIREGKGKKDRVVPLGRIAAKYLETYINGIRPQFMRTLKGESATRTLFLSLAGGSPDPKTLQKMLNKYTRRARLKIRVTPHVFRHSCATHMIRNRAGIRHVQELLGHCQLTTTQQYVRVTITDLKEAHNKFHPREKDR